MGFNKIKRPSRGQFYTPDTLEVMYPVQSIQTSSGHLTSNIADESSLESSGYKFKSYMYLATGRFFSTQVTPSEYGDGDVFDSLICIVHTVGMPDEAIALLKPTALVKITRSQYQDEPTLYRIVTGNPYPDHVEIKIVPMVL